MQYAKEISVKYSILPKKKFGQNFLVDDAVISDIVSNADVVGRTILEIGPGTGNMTKEILRAGAKSVIVVERDDECMSALIDLRNQHHNLEIINEDALKIDESIFVKHGEKLKIVSNLPYNVGTALLVKWLKKIDLFDDMVLMFQKEVADRIVAVPKTSKYGRLSVITQLLCSTKKLFDVAPEAFWPAPKVTSSVIFLSKRPKPLSDCNFSVLEDFLQIAFSQKRKMLRNTLKKVYGDEALNILDLHGIAKTARAEELTVEKLCELSQYK